MKEKYLPIGTVVLLKNGSKTIMITGYLAMKQDSNDKTTFDYSACLFPEGLLSSNQNIVFNHEQINIILFEGFKNEQSEMFLNEVKNISYLQQNNESVVSQNISTSPQMVSQNQQTMAPTAIYPTSNPQMLSPIQQAMPPTSVPPTPSPQIQSNPFAEPIFTNNYNNNF